MKNTVLLYDDNCPLCAGYSALFVKSGFLDKEERVAFSTADETILARIDLEKGMNEIPLVDLSGGKVEYGIDALLTILGRRIPFIKAVGSFRPVRWLLQRLYRFISYNRKVIVARKCGPGAIDCSPSFNLQYRVLFMTVSLVFNTVMLIPLHALLETLPWYHHRLSDLQLGHFSLLLMNGLLAGTLSFRKAVDYLGQVNMLALTTTLLLIPLLILEPLSGPFFITLYLAVLTFFIFREYLRRMDYTGTLSGNRFITSANLTAMSFFLLYLFNYSS